LPSGPLKGLVADMGFQPSQVYKVWELRLTRASEEQPNQAEPAFDPQF